MGGWRGAAIFGAAKSLLFPVIHERELPLPTYLYSYSILSLIQDGATLLSLRAKRGNLLRKEIGRLPRFARKDRRGVPFVRGSMFFVNKKKGSIPTLKRDTQPPCILIRAFCFCLDLCLCRLGSSFECALVSADNLAVGFCNCFQKTNHPTYFVCVFL